MPVLIGRLSATAVVVAVLPILLGEYDLSGNLELVLLKAFPTLILAGITAAGCVLIGEAWPARIGQTEHCATCGHPWIPEDHILIPHCQECGACWRWFGGRVVGARHFRPRLLAAGLVLLVLPPAAMLAEAVGAFSAFSQRSNALLLKSLESGLSADAVRDLEVLVERSADTPAIAPQIAAAILNRRGANGALPPQLTAWMSSSIGAGRLTAAEIDRWYLEMIEFKVEVPAFVPAGELAAYSITAKFKGGWEEAADVPQLVHGGFTVGDQAAPQGQSPYTTPVQSLKSWETLYTGVLSLPDTPGRVEVRGRAWLIIGRPVTTVVFDGQGVPQAPPGAVVREYTWTRPIEVLSPK